MMLNLLANPAVSKHVSRRVNGRGVNIDDTTHLDGHLQ
jgi:hypothetical protein